MSIALMMRHHALLAAAAKKGGGLPSFSIKVLAVNSDESREWFENNDKFDSCDVVSQTDDTITYLIKRDDTDWSMMFVLNDDNDENPYLLEVLDANTSGVINMESMCDTCTSLTSIPLFDTSSVENMDYILYECVNVESGALALYQQASTRADEISHSGAFCNCGADTESGLAELQQIPVSWGGLAPFTIKVLAVNSEESRNFFENNYFYDSCDVVAQTDDTITYVIKSSDTNLDSFFVVFDDNDQYAENPYLLQVLESDTSGVENMQRMFLKCINLTSVQLDTSSVKNMQHMFYGCIGLTSIPSLDITNAILTGFMFSGCVNVESGALEFYNRASSSGNVESHADTFNGCGINTESGRAELAQIPDDWK